MLVKIREPEKVQCEKCMKVSRPATCFCQDCRQFICSTCKDVHVNWEELRCHKVVSIGQLQGDASQHDRLKIVTHLCSRHKDQQLRLYCETCEDLICYDCTVRLHKGHQYDLISDAFEGYKADIVAALEPVKEDVAIVDDKMKQLDARCAEITDRRGLVAANVYKEIQGFIEILKRREAELVSEVDRVAQEKLKNLAAQRDEIETIQARLGSCLSFVSECLQVGNEGEIMKMKKRVVKQVNVITAEFNADSLAPCEEANFGFVTAVDFPNACHQLGDVYISYVTAENCYATGKGLEVALVNWKATACMYIFDQFGKSVDNSVLDRILVEVGSDTETSKCSVKKIKDNQYQICYQPTSIGRHQLHIKIDSKHIKGSPFTVIVRDPINIQGMHITTIKGVKQPWGVAVNKKEEVVVAENNADCVSVYSPNGEKLRSFGSHGSGQGQFDRPRGVAVDDDGNILVADSRNHRIQKFNSDGEFITAVGSEGNKPLHFNVPTGIAIHPVSKRVYVTESLNRRVQILNPDLTSHTMFGIGKGCVEPRGLAFDSTHNVYISEHRENTKIEICTENGDHLGWFGNVTLNSPFDVSIDSNNTVYVCDSNNHRICIFDFNGTLLHSFGSNGTAPGQFDFPCGIAIDENGLIYVSDKDNDRVQIHHVY